jgi:tetratricopeptide (TPR) repeat protein
MDTSTALQAREWQRRGFALGEQGDWEGSRVAYESAIRLHPFACESWVGKGAALEGLGHLEQALDCYDIATNLSLHSFISVEKKGLALHRLGRFDEALACFVAAAMIGAARADTLCWALIYQAMSLTRLERCADALDCCDHALEIAPTAEAWVTKGNALRDLERFEEALSCYVQATALCPRDEMARYNRGLVEEDLGRMADAARTYRGCLTLGMEDKALEARVRRRLARAERALEAA